MEHSLQLNASLDLPGIEKILNVLRHVPGVRAVEASPGSADVHVQYDDDLTSSQEIRTTLARSGFPLKPAAHAGGGCCGSCGGF